MTMAFGVAIGTRGADVYGNKNVAWTNNDSIIFDLHRKRAQMERSTTGGPTSEQIIKAWVEGRQEARRQWANEAADREAARTERPKPKAEPEAPKVSYEAWSEEHNRKRANAGEFDGMYLYGRRLLETGRSHGRGWLEDAAKRGDLDSAKYLLDRANGLSGGKKELAQKRSILTLLMNSPKFVNTRWHYGELLAATYDGSEAPRDAAELAKVLDALLKSGDQYNPRFYNLAATQLSELYSSGEGVPQDLDRALALARDALAHTKEPTPAQLMQLANVLAMSEGSYRDHHAEIIKLWNCAAEGKGPGQPKAVERLLALFAGENESLAVHLKLDELRKTSPVRWEDEPARQNLFRAAQAGCQRAWPELIEAADQFGFQKRHAENYEARHMLSEAGKAGFSRAYGLLALKMSRSIDLTTRSWAKDIAEKGIAAGDPTSYAARARLGELEWKPDWTKIHADYQRAGEGGLLMGMYRTAEILRSGHLGVQNNSGAFEWMNRAADAGLAIARVEVARMLVEGSGTSRQPERGINILKEAIQHRVTEAYRMLGYYLAIGKGVEQDVTLGYQYLRYAALSEDVEAMNLMGLATMSGQGVKQDRREARKWLKQAAEMEYLPACRNLAHLLWTEPRPADQQAVFEKAVQENGRSPNDFLEADFELFLSALSTLTRVADTAPGVLQVQIGLMLLNRENEFAPPFGYKNIGAANLLFERAAVKNDELGQYYHGLTLLANSRLSTSPEESINLSREGLAMLRKAAATFQPDASRILNDAELWDPASPFDDRARTRLQAAAVKELQDKAP